MPHADDAARREDVLRGFLAHQGMLRAYAFAIIGDWDAADEAVQETAVYVCAHWADLPADGDFAAWARGVARLRALECRRRRPRGGVAPDVAAALPIAESEAGAAERSALSRCIEALPADAGQLIDWHYRDGLAGDVIADRLGRSIDAVYMALSRARRRLRDCMRRRLAGEAP